MTVHVSSLPGAHFFFFDGPSLSTGRMKYSLEYIFQVIILEAAGFPQHNVVLKRSNQANLELWTYLFTSVPE